MEFTSRASALLDAEAPNGAPVHRPALSGRPVEEPSPGDRIRAARAAADLNREELASLIGSSARTIRRLEDEKRRATPDELRSIAVACRSPEWFLTHGWRGFEHEGGD